MTYRLTFPAFGRFFNVPCAAVDNYIKTADGDFYKVLLCALCSDSPLFDTAQLAERAGVSAAAAEDAVLFWIARGVLAAEPADGAKLPEAPAAIPVSAPVMTPVAAPMMTPAAVPAPAEKTAEPERTAPSKMTVKYSPKDIADRSRESREIADLFEQVQKILGRPINPTEAAGFLGIYEYFGLSVPSIMILTQYTHDIGKDRMRYIETVARDWFDRGITEYADVEREIGRLTEQGRKESHIKNLLHVDLRLTKKQEQMFAEWTEWGFTDDMIALADEKSRENIFKTDLKYINGVLRRWHEEGIRTPADVAESEKRFAKGKKQSADKGENSSFSIEEWYRQAEDYDPEAVSFSDEGDDDQ